MPAVKKVALDDQRRESVLKAARKVFESKGLEGATMRMIATAARSTTGSIYPYFRGKEEIYAELLSRSLAHYRENLATQVGKARTPADRFAAVLFAHFDHYEARPSDMSLALYLFNGLKPQGLTKELDARLNDQLESILDVFRACVQELAGCTPAQADPEVGLHYSVLFGLLILYHTHRTRVFRIDARRVLEMHVRDATDRLVKGIAPPAARRRRKVA